MSSEETIEVRLGGALYEHLREVADLSDVPLEHIARVALAVACIQSRVTSDIPMTVTGEER